MHVVESAVEFAAEVCESIMYPGVHRMFIDGNSGLYLVRQICLGNWRTERRSWSCSEFQCCDSVPIQVVLMLCQDQLIVGFFRLFRGYFCQFCGLLCVEYGLLVKLSKFFELLS